MARLEDHARKIVPAQLNFLAIYSPVLGTREDNQKDQIVYYYSKDDHEPRRKRGKEAVSAPEGKDVTNEQLRQVGLAQGMLNFARGFSAGAPLDSVESEKHRIVATELEQEWWISASIDLTRLPSSTQGPSSTAQYEYSSREVSPPALLIQQLLSAYSTFLLHQSHTLSDLYVRLSREKFCQTLESFWTPFALNWDVLLHGSPATDIFRGLKLAAGGELGIGVGEEEWGSGEREVLEGLIRNTEGLVDLMVSRYGYSEHASGEQSKTTEAEPWLGRRIPPEPSDGMLFSGVGALSPIARRDITRWLEDVYMYGDDAYGVRDRSRPERRRRRRRRPPVPGDGEHNGSKETPTQADAGDRSGEAVVESAKQEDHSPEKSNKSPTVDAEAESAGPRIPPPIVSAAAEPHNKGNQSVESETKGPDKQDGYKFANSFGSSEIWGKYLTLGYGTAWGSSKQPQQQADGSGKLRDSQNGPTRTASNNEDLDAPSASHLSPKQTTETEPKSTPGQLGGHFVIGLKGDLNEDGPPSSPQEADERAESGWSNRLFTRILYVSLNQTPEPPRSVDVESTDSMASTHSTPNLPQHARRAKLRTVIYAHEPFLYTLLFEPTCSLLSYPSYFHDLHHHLTPLHGPLARSADPAAVASSMSTALSQSSSETINPIHSLIYSPGSLVIRSNIANIPAPGTAAAEGIASPTATLMAEANAWTRVEALAVHSRILDTISETREGRDITVHNVKRGERERTLKTGKGWWIVWLRVADPSAKLSSGLRTPDVNMEASIHGSHIQEGHTLEVRGKKEDEYEEAILVRRSADASSAGGRRTAYRTMSTSGGATAWMQGMSSSALAPFSRFAAGSRTPSGAVGQTLNSVTGTGGVGTVGGIGVDARKYVESLLRLDR